MKTTCLLDGAIGRILADQGHGGRYDPRHIEAWIRLEHVSLASMSPEHLTREVRVARRCVDDAGVERSEALARSWGL